MPGKEPTEQEYLEMLTDEQREQYLANRKKIIDQLFGEKLQPPPRLDRWNIVLENLSDLYNAYNDRECESVIPPQHHNPAIDDKIDRCLFQLMVAYDNWLD